VDTEPATDRPPDPARRQAAAVTTREEPDMNVQTTTTRTVADDTTRAPLPVERGSRRRVHPAIWVALVAVLLGAGIAVAERPSAQVTDRTTTVQQPSANVREGRIGQPAGQPVGQEPTANQREGRAGQPAVQVPNANQREGRIPRH
jgi:cytoskeletal protein RodZ